MEQVVITGAASGLGKAMALHWFNAGHRVILVDLDAAGLTLLSEQLAAQDSQRVVSHALDLCDEPARERLVAALQQEPGIDVLINNAGITHRSLAHDTDPAVLWKVMAVDWQAPVALTLACLPMLAKRQGKIINIGSMAGWMPVLGRAGYCSAKAALGQFFEVLRGEVASQGVSVLMVYPSFLDTPIEQNALGKDGKPATHRRSMAGGMRTAEWMAERVYQAHCRHQPRLFPDRFTALSSILWRVWPSLYYRLMVRRFASELSAS